MNKSELIDFLKENLRIEIDFSEAHAYWDSSNIEVRLILDGDEISQSSVSVPEWQKKQSEGF
jgi:hypothetical protein